MLTRKLSKRAKAESVRRRLIFDGPRDGVLGNDGVIRHNDAGFARTNHASNSTPHQSTNDRLSLFKDPGVLLVDAGTAECREDVWSLNGSFASDPKQDIDSIFNTSSNDHWSSASFYIFGACIVMIPVTFLPWTNVFLSDFEIREDEDHNQLLFYQNHPMLCIFGFLLTLFTAAAVSLTCVGFSWTILYFDSMEPGKNPPAPFSPAKYRKKSGHTFHIGYTLSLFNGLLLFIYYLWYTQHSFLR